MTVGTRAGLGGIQEAWIDAPVLPGAQWVPPQVFSGINVNKGFFERGKKGFFFLCYFYFILGLRGGRAGGPVGVKVSP